MRMLLTMLLAALWLGGCLDRSGTPADELVFALPSNPTNLDPRFAPDAFSDRIARLVFSPLLERRARKRWGGEPAYERYVQSTPSLVPRPPRP